MNFDRPEILRVTKWLVDEHFYILLEEIEDYFYIISCDRSFQDHILLGSFSILKRIPIDIIFLGYVYNS
jgi:hypothetical protein